LNSPLEVVKLLDFTLDNVRRLLCDFDVVHLAAQNDKLDILEYLLNRNPGIVNLRDKSEALPLHYAVLSGSL
jgi:ankyrin repeat protein